MRVNLVHPLRRLGYLRYHWSRGEVDRREEDKGSGSKASHAIFASTRAVRESSDVLVCRLVGGKVTFVHRERWPALVRCAGHFPREHLAQIEERHTPSGRHVIESVPFPEWVPSEILKASEGLSEEHAFRILGPWAK